MIRLLGLSSLLLCSACFECLDPGGGGSGGGSGGGGDESFVAEYSLVEATGSWNVTGSAVSGGCTHTTTSAVRTLSLAAPVKNAATFSSNLGLLQGFAQVQGRIEARAGTTSCTSGTMRACPSTADQAQDLPFVFVTVAAEPGLPLDAPDGLAFVPVITAQQLPELCDRTQFSVSKGWLRGKPITVAQLKSGRFVVEASGTLPLLPAEVEAGDPDPAPVSGTLTYSFRLVYQTDDYDPSKAVEPPQLPSFDECLVDLEPTEDDLERAEAEYADGGTDIALNSTGCRRLSVTRGSGTLAVQHSLTRGTKLVFDAASGTTRAERDSVVLYSLTEDAAGEHEKFDFDLDGTFEQTTETTFSGADWASSVATLGATKSTQTRLDASTMRVRFEEGGVLVEEFDTAIRQRACFEQSSMYDPACAPPAPMPGGPACGGTPAPCTKAQRKAIKKQLAAALKKGTKCMKDMSFDGFQPEGKGLTLATMGKLNFICDPDPCSDYGSLSRGANGKFDFTINTSRAVGAEAAKTLFHEMLHSDPSFSHNDTLVSLAAKACKLQITDRTYACETMCFAPSRGGSCACVRCLNPKKGAPAKELCDKCSKFGTCPGRQGVRSNGMMGNISQGVGAYCERGKIYCDTKAECDTACTLGGGCQQTKTVCDDNCN